jgi:hypothetical protein
VASEVKKSPAQVALAWLLSKSTVTSVLLGASKLEQLENNLGSLDAHLSPDQIKRLDDISRVEMSFPHAILANPTIEQTISGGVEVHRNWLCGSKAASGGTAVRPGSAFRWLHHNPLAAHGVSSGTRCIGRSPNPGACQ